MSVNLRTPQKMKVSKYIGLPAFEVIADDDFHHEFHQHMHELQQTNTLTDFVIKCGSSIPCHKVVLAAASPYFRAMFRTGMKEVRKQEATLHLDEDVVSQIIEFFYTGTFHLQMHNAKNAVEAFDYLQIGYLREEYEKWMLKHLRPENCISWYNIASAYSMNDLQKAAKAMMHHQFSEVAESGEFLSLSVDEVIKYMRDNDIEKCDQNMVLDVCMQWIKADVEQRIVLIKTLMMCVDLSRCSYDFLVQARKKNLHLFNDELQQMWWSAMEDKVDRQESQGRPDGASIVFIGGLPLSECKALHSETWKTFSQFPPEREGSTRKGYSVCIIKDGILLTGGSLNTIYLTSSSIYFSKFDTWSKVLDMPFALKLHASAEVQKYVIVVGGKMAAGEAATNKETLLFDSGENSWSLGCQSLISLGNFPILAKKDTNLYCITTDSPGNNSITNKFGVTLQIYDVIRDKWSLGASPIISDKTKNTNGAVSSIVGDFLYLVGGRGRLCDRYSIASDTWTVMTKLDNISRFGSSLVLDEKILVFGGCNDIDVLSEHTDEVWEYDTKNDKWQLANLKCPSLSRRHVVGWIKFSDGFLEKKQGQ